MVDHTNSNRRMRPEQKAALVRAAALRNSDLTEPTLRETAAIIDAADHLKVSEPDRPRVLDLLEHPPAPNAKLRAAAAMPAPAT